jgi:hypothetical protein
MKLDYITIILLIFIIISIFYLIYKYYPFYTNEHFETYSYGPYNYMDTGADPLTFYRYPIYRQPYMYPYKFYSSYPYPYMTYWPTNI